MIGKSKRWLSTSGVGMLFLLPSFCGMVIFYVFPLFYSGMVSFSRTTLEFDFVGGIRGLGELEKRVAQGWEVAFSMYPTSMAELFDIADQGLLMPPKSTWFEPKLRSGLFIHEF